MTPRSKSNAGGSGVGLFLHLRWGTSLNYRILLFKLFLSVLCFAALSASAAMQFDVFLGYDGVVPEATWFPILFEIKNDGPSFTGTVELTAENMNQDQARRMIVELPTGTLKR